MLSRVSRLLVACWWAMTAQGGIASQDTLPADCWIRDATSSGPNTLWVLCEQGWLLHTADGGVHWTVRHVPAAGGLRAIAVVGSDYVVVAGQGGGIWISSDAGQHWETVNSGTTRRLNDLYFVGELGWAVGEGGIILHSRDAGRTWRQQPTLVTVPLEAVFFRDQDHGWAVGWFGTILVTTDGGARWRVVEGPDPTARLTGVHFSDPKRGWVVGVPATVWRTDDGGLTWQAVRVPLTGWLSAVRCDGEWVYVAGDELLMSRDGGRSWSVIEVPVDEALIRVAIEGGAVWVISPRSIMASLDGGQSWARRLGLGLEGEVAEPGRGVEGEATEG